MSMQIEVTHYERRLLVCGLRNHFSMLQANYKNRDMPDDLQKMINDMISLGKRLDIDDKINWHIKPFGD